MELRLTQSIMKLALPVFIGFSFIFLFLIQTQPVLAQVKLNEIFANPVNEDDEFIELYNPTDQAIDISGYKLSDLTNKPQTITETTIPAKSFYSLKQVAFKFQLNNSGPEVVTLKDGLDTVIDSFSYDGTDEGFSYSRIPDGGGWLAKTIPTENNANIAPPSSSPSPATSPSPNPAASPSSSQTAASPAPSPTSTPSPSPNPSPVIRITNIVLLNRETPEPILGASSSQNSDRPPIDWQLAAMLIAAGTGLLLATTFIMIRSWRKK